MKKIILRNGKEIEISENEFRGAIDAINKKQLIFISRLECGINPFEVSEIVPIDYQLEYGKPYKILGKQEKIISGRFFVDDGIVMKLSGIHGLAEFNSYENLKDCLISEDEYLDKISEEKMKGFPNNLLTQDKNKELNSGK